jgi:integrase
MFQKAIEWGKASAHPVRTLRPFRTANHRLRYLSLEEIRRLLQAADVVLCPIVLTALHTGLGRGELFALTWQDIDTKAKVIRVVQTKNGERREIPITPTLWDALQRMPRRLGAKLVFAGKTGQGLVDIRKRFRCLPFRHRCRERNIARHQLTLSNLHPTRRTYLNPIHMA